MIPSAASSCLCGSSSSVLSPELHANKKDNDQYPLIDESTDLPVCDYDVNPTPLYQAMEAHQWGAVAAFLKTGVWPGHFFSDSKTPKEQVKTWIHRYNHDTHQEVIDDLDDNVNEVNTTKTGTSTYHFKSVEERARLNRLRRTGKRVLRWRQLPLHAGLIFMAPPSIVKQIVELFPYALRCPDDKGMLPLHLAFRQAVPDDILTVLLRLFPNGMHVRDQKGRLPVECVRIDSHLLGETNTGPPAVRGMIIQSIMQQSKEKFSQEQQATVNKFQTDVQSLQTKMEQLESQLHQVNHREEQTRNELTSTLEELQALKKHHRKLQEMQQFSMQRQTQQEAAEKQQFEFQQRIMEQLQLQAETRDDQHHHHHHGNNRHSSRARGHRHPPPSSPFRAPSLPRQESNSGRPPTPSSYSEPLFNKYQADAPGTVTGNDSEEHNISYSSGGSRYSSDYTKQTHRRPSAGLPLPPTSYTAQSASAYTGISSHHHHQRNKNNISPPNMDSFKQRTASRDSYTTKLTRDDTATAYTNGYYYNSEVEEEDDGTAKNALGGGRGRRGGGGGDSGILGRRPKATASAVHGHPLQTSTAATAAAATGKEEQQLQQKAAGNTGMCPSSPQSPFDNWDFSGIFKPLAVKGDV